MFSSRLSNPSRLKFLEEVGKIEQEVEEQAEKQNGVGLVQIEVDPQHLLAYTSDQK